MSAICNPPQPGDQSYENFLEVCLVNLLTAHKASLIQLARDFNCEFLLNE